MIKWYDVASVLFATIIAGSFVFIPPCLVSIMYLKSIDVFITLVIICSIVFTISVVALLITISKEN